MSIRLREVKGVINTHLNNGACQNQTFFVKNDIYFLFHGFITTKEGKQMTLKRGWYDKDFNFISEVTKEEDDRIEDTPPF